MNATKKYSMIWDGKKYYLLGNNIDGASYFLRDASFDGGWYWSGGYVRSFTNNRSPVNSKDIMHHTHFDSLFLDVPHKYAFDAFKEFFVETPFADGEIWKICELMKSFYIAIEYSHMLHRGGANCTKNPASETIKSETEYNRINKEVIPAIVSELHKILEG